MTSFIGSNRPSQRNSFTSLINRFVNQTETDAFFEQVFRSCVMSWCHELNCGNQITLSILFEFIVGNACIIRTTLVQMALVLCYKWRPPCTWMRLRHFDVIRLLRFCDSKQISFIIFFRFCSSNNFKKMQPKTADFVPVPPPGELDETYASSLILANSLHYVKTWRHQQSGKYTTLCTAVKKDQATASVTCTKIWRNLSV